MYPQGAWVEGEVDGYVSMQMVEVQRIGGESDLRARGAEGKHINKLTILSLKLVMALLICLVSTQ